MCRTTGCRRVRFAVHRRVSRILDEYELTHSLHAYGTNIEGDYDEVFEAIKACHEKIHTMGAPRITTAIKLGTRVDKKQTLRDKIASVEARRKNHQ